MKEWECVQVGHHKKIGKVCEEYQKKGGPLPKPSMRDVLDEDRSELARSSVTSERLYNMVMPFLEKEIK